MPRIFIAAQRLSAIVVAGAMAGCVSIQPLEPMLSPPPEYQLDVAVKVEFVHPLKIGFRCAERGAKFLGLPGINSGACSDRSLMTMPNPCLTLTGGSIARDICRELDLIRTASGSDDEDFSARSVDAAGAAPLPAQPIPASFKAALKAKTAGLSAANTQALREDRSDPEAVAAISVEFVEPDRLAYRCAERGAKFIKEDGVLACSDAAMLTVANPCHLPSLGWYGDMLCHEMGHANGWSAGHSGGSLQRRGPIRLASESPEARALAKAKGSDVIARIALQAPNSQEQELPRLAAAPAPQPAQAAQIASFAGLPVPIDALLAACPIENPTMTELLEWALASDAPEDGQLSVAKMVVSTNRAENPPGQDSIPS